MLELVFQRLPLTSETLGRCESSLSAHTTHLPSGLWVRRQCCSRPLWATWALPVLQGPVEKSLALFVVVLAQEPALVVQAIDCSVALPVEKPKLGLGRQKARGTA